MVSWLLESGDDVMHLQIHLIERLLHVLNVACSQIDEAGAVAQ